MEVIDTYEKDTPIKKIRREKIISVSKDLFYKRGLFNTTMKDISKASGIGRSTMYEYFNTKEELMKCIKREYLKDIYDLDLSLDKNLNGLEELEVILEKYFDILLTKPEAVIFFMEYNRLVTVDHLENEKIEIEVYKSHEYISRAMQKGKIDKTLDIDNISKRIQIIIETIFGVASRIALTKASREDVNEYNIEIEEVKNLIQIMLYGITTKKCKKL